MPDLDARLPSSLQAISETRRLGADVPSLVVRPESAPLGGGDRIPFLLWMHGRTATKELDPGRYLRLARAGIGACAIDLPGHGERETNPSYRWWLYCFIYSLWYWKLVSSNMGKSRK